jgi:uncharacterized membrane protein
MRRYLVSYATTFVVLLVVDIPWLTVAGRLLYRPRLGALLAPDPILWAAACFYLIYSAGVVIFAVTPGLAADSAMRAATLGALLGIVAYATYDLTNQATLQGWSALVTIVDLAWGAVLTAVAAAAGFFAARSWG